MESLWGVRNHHSHNCNNHDLGQIHSLAHKLATCYENCIYENVTALEYICKNVRALESRVHSCWSTYMSECESKWAHRPNRWMTTMVHDLNGSLKNFSNNSNFHLFIPYLVNPFQFSVLLGNRLLQLSYCLSVSDNVHITFSNVVFVWNVVDINGMLSQSWIFIHKGNE